MGFFYTCFTLKEKKKKKVRLTSAIWAVGLITCRALLPAGPYHLQVPYLTDKCFGIVWGPPGTPPKKTPINQFFERLNFGCQCCLKAVDI